MPCTALEGHPVRPAVVVGLCVLAAAAALLLIEGGGPRWSAAATGDSPPAPQAEASAPARAPASAEIIATVPFREPSDEESPGRTIQILVIHADDGTAVPAATVTWTASSVSEEGLAMPGAETWRRQGVLQTDDAGRARLPEFVRWLRAEKGSLAGSRVLEDDVRGIVRVELRPAAWIFARVVDEESRPVGGVVVTARLRLEEQTEFLSGISEPKRGRVRLGALPARFAIEGDATRPRPDAVIRAHARIPALWGDGAVARGAGIVDGSLTVTIPERAPLRIEVVDPTGAPLPAPAYVLVGASEDNEWQEEDVRVAPRSFIPLKAVRAALVDGVAVLETVPCDEQLALTVISDRWEAVTVTARSLERGERRTVSIHVRRARCRATARILDVDGNPFRSRLVAIQPAGNQNLGALIGDPGRVRTDEQGNVTFPLDHVGNWKRAPLNVVVLRDGASILATGRVWLDARRLNDARMQLGVITCAPPRLHAAGRVLDGEGRPVHGARVAASRSSAEVHDERSSHTYQITGLHRRPGLSTWSGADGRFVLASTPEWSVRKIRISRPGYAARTIDLPATSPPTNLEVVLKRLP